MKEFPKANPLLQQSIGYAFGLLAYDKYEHGVVEVLTCLLAAVDPKVSYPQNVNSLLYLIKYANSLRLTPPLSKPGVTSTFRFPPSSFLSPTLPIPFSPPSLPKFSPPSYVAYKTTQSMKEAT